MRYPYQYLRKATAGPAGVVQGTHEVQKAVCNGLGRLRQRRLGVSELLVDFSAAFQYRLEKFPGGNFPVDHQLAQPTDAAARFIDAARSGLSNREGALQYAVEFLGPDNTARKGL